MAWPNHFPANCPPIQSEAASGEFYRVVVAKNNNGLKAEDFQSQREKQPNKTQWKTDVPECYRCSISILQDINESVRHAEKLLEVIPKRVDK